MADAVSKSTGVDRRSDADLREINGETSVFLHIGDPIRQVRFSETLNKRFRGAELDGILVPFHVPVSDFDNLIPLLKRSENIKGIVLTVPFKNRAVAFVDRLLPLAAACGSVNAMRRGADGLWEGENFDGSGLLHALRTNGVDPAGKRVLLVGTGGAGKSIAAALAAAGVSGVDLYDADRARIAETIRTVGSISSCCVARSSEPKFDGQDILINATPIGMAEEAELPIDLAGVGPLNIVFDIVGKPPVTPLMKAAQAREAIIIGGMAMIEGQTDNMCEFFRDSTGP